MPFCTFTLASKIHNFVPNNIIMKTNARRKFLRNIGLASLSAGILPSVLKASDSQGSLMMPPPPEECNATTEDAYGTGPFYSPNAPDLASDLLLAPANEVGTRLIISGVVRTLDCSEIIKDAVIDIWHADDNGAYDNDGFHLRGVTKSNAAGFYTFDTILPGKYLNGDSFRPSHIHFKVTAPGYPELITQIYFSTNGVPDESIPDDFAAGKTSGEFDATFRIIELTTNTDGKLEGNWDIVIDGDGSPIPINTSGIESLHLENGMIYKAGPNPFSEKLEIFYGVFKEALVTISVTDIQGKKVAEITEENHTPEKYTAIWNPNPELPDGVYIVFIKINGLQVHHQKVVRNAHSY